LKDILLEYKEANMFAIIKDYINDLKGISRNVKLFIITNILHGIILGATWSGLGIVIENSFNPTILGGVFVTHALGIAVSSVPVGFSVNKYGYKPIFMAGIIISSLSFLLNGYISSITLLYILNFIFGLSQGIFEVLSAPFISVNTKKKERASIMSVMFGIYWLTILITVKASSGFILLVQNQFKLNQITSYSYYTLVIAALGILGVFSVSAMDDFDIRGVFSAPKRFLLKDNIKVIVNKEVIIYLAYIGFIGLGAGLFNPLFSNFFKDSFSLDNIVFDNLFYIQYFVMILGIFLCPILIKRFGQVVILGSASLISIPFMLIVINSLHLGNIIFPTLLFAFFMRSGFMNLALPIMYSLPLDFVEKEKKAPLAGVISLFSWVIRGLSSLVVGYVVALPAFNWSNSLFPEYIVPYYILVILYVVAVIILISGLNKKYNNRTTTHSF